MHFSVHYYFVAIEYSLSFIAFKLGPLINCMG